MRTRRFVAMAGRFVGRRLLLGLLISLIAIVLGWTLVPPEVGTDAKTVYWYTH